MAGLWQNPALRQLTGDTIRPGGLELTIQAMTSLALAPGARVLDAGCGTGVTLQWLQSQGWQAEGVDFSPEFVKQAGAVCGRKYVTEASIMKLPHADHYFDAVISECVLSVLPDLAAALAELNRVLKPGGYLVWADLYRRRQTLPAACLNSAGPAPCLAGARSREAMEHFLAAAGFFCSAFADHSRYLAELAGRMILHNSSELRDFLGLCDLKGLGYGFALAIKKEMP